MSSLSSEVLTAFEGFGLILFFGEGQENIR